MKIIGKEKAVCPYCGRKIRNTRSFKETIRRIPELRMNPAFNYVMLALLAIGTGLISLLLGASFDGLPLFWSYFWYPKIIALNLLPSVLIIFLIYFAGGRAWMAFTFPSIIITAFSLVEFFKIQVRGDPFVMSDFSYIREAGNVVSTYALTMNWKVVVAPVALVLGVLFSIFILKYRQKNTRVRIIASVAIIAVSASLYSFVYTNKDLYAKTAVTLRGTEWSAVRSYISKGFLYPFIHSIPDSMPAAPEWYDEQAARQSLEQYSDTDIPDDKKVDVISIMLESYADFSSFGMLDFLEDVYGPLHSLQAESVSGMLIDNIFGGGTIDTERLFMTGNTHLTTYKSATNSFIQYLRSQGYRTEGLHTGDMWFYDRLSVNSFLGFDKYYYLEDFEDSSRDDSFFFPTLMDLYRSRDADKPYFSYGVTYQNHGAYSSSRTSEPYYIAQDGLSNEAFNTLNNYLSGINDTTLRLEGFIDSLRDSADPVLVVAFGDHMPWLGNEPSVYVELGINVDFKSDEGFYNYFSTPYFVWANDTAKEMLSNDFIGAGDSFSPCFLMGEVFSLCSWEGEGYMQALRELKQTVDVISSPTGLFRENGVLTQELSPDAMAAYMKLRMIEYYRLNNFRY